MLLVWTFLDDSFSSICFYHLPQNIHKTFHISESQVTNIFKAHAVGCFQQT